MACGRPKMPPPMMVLERLKILPPRLGWRNVQEAIVKANLRRCLTCPASNMACYLSISVIIPHHLPDTVLTSIIHLLLTIAKDRGAKPSSLWWFPKQEAAGKRKKHCFIPAWNHSCSLVRRMHVSKKVQTRECQTCTRCETHMCTRSSMQVKTMHGIHRRNRDRGSRNQKHLNGMFKTFQNIACTWSSEMALSGSPRMLKWRLVRVKVPLLSSTVSRGNHFTESNHCHFRNHGSLTDVS